MFAVIKTGGKQYRVSKDDVIAVEMLDGEAGGTIVFGEVLMLGDGNAEFTTAMGLTMDGSKFGLGTRSQRYAMVVQDGVIKELFVEKPGAFEVSSAEYVLKHL